ncbi:MAG: polyprenyl synthetase family protein [Planctomycetota bacterium]
MTSASRRDTAVDGVRWLDEAARAIDTRLHELLPLESVRPQKLHRAMRHSVLAGGKRIRPALVLAIAEGLGARREDALDAGCAVEFVHTYSLVHDDLPAMDDDELRRGRPTCHVVFGEATAILVGDALLTFAFEVLAGTPRAADAVRELAVGAGSLGMVGGQEIDMDPGARLHGEAGVEEVHRMKTAALMGASAALGAVAAGADAGTVGRARRFGTDLGLAFQAVDDVLDVTEDAATLGKTPGKDARLDRDSLVGTLGLDAARERAVELGRAASASLDAIGLAHPAAARAILERVLERRS